MKIKDFCVMMACCFFWAANFVISKWAVADHSVQPFLLAAVRAIFVLLIMFPFLRTRRPLHFKRLILVCACVGPLHLAFLYTGLKTASASASSIVSQMMIPFAAVLSMIFLKETLGWRRTLGILGALIGVIILVYDPKSVGFNLGLIYIIIAYIFIAIGTVLCRSESSKSVL